MRENKFRGKCGDKWVYGWYASDWEGQAYIITELGPSITCCSDCGANSIKAIEVDLNTVSQYTGLNDKNGKEIYEGDFFKDVADEYLWQVFYDEGCYYASSGPDTLMLQEFLMESGKCDVEVVGNIYDNPELIGGEVNGDPENIS